MTPETLYTNQANSLNRGSPVLLSVTPSRNVSIQVLEEDSTSHVRLIQPLVCHRNNFPGECLAMWQSSVPLSKRSSLAHAHGCLAHARSCDKGLLKERIINKSWRKIITSRGETIPDNRLAPTFYKLSLGRCSHQKSLSVTETWALSIGIRKPGF